ncbi:hypothetical protein SCHPADRAFT_904449 [Schizopora paradoxa]|uniref:Uncharacterized protein n=1 Tax=Schizopora paradoxa TaxID=27342 RepID=A0A0H2RMG5_9AGAM|nr:hypothetical protein SCHPADRAFT_904449 [Schizopora paradoxa]
MLASLNARSMIRKRCESSSIRVSVLLHSNTSEIKRSSLRSQSESGANVNDDDFFKAKRCVLEENTPSPSQVACKGMGEEVSAAGLRRHSLSHC